MSEKRDKRYRAVTLFSCPESCAAAHAHSGKKLLLADFEQLVLRHCHKPLCYCQFQQHPDRRSGFDRRYIGPNASQPVSLNNRRMSYGRRVADDHNRARDKTGEIELIKAISELISS